MQCQTAALFLRTAVAGVRRRKSLLAELSCVCGRGDAGDSGIYPVGARGGSFLNESSYKCSETGPACPPAHRTVIDRSTGKPITPFRLI